MRNYRRCLNARKKPQAEGRPAVGWMQSCDSCGSTANFLPVGGGFSNQLLFVPLVPDFKGVDVRIFQEQVQLPVYE